MRPTPRLRLRRRRPTSALLPALALVSLASSLAAQDLRLPAVFGDHMVLQRQSSVPVWGWAAPGAEIAVAASWLPAAATARAGTDGRWRVDLSTGDERGPQRLEIVAAGERLAFDDVLLGEVWVCSGQSNMEWSFQATADGYAAAAAYEADLARADLPELRLFDVAHQFSWEPREDCEGKWTACTPRSVLGFSAIGYWFGRELHAELGVPIGLIGSNWGGTLCEAWTSAEGLARRQDFDGPLALIRELREHPERAAWKKEERLSEWRGRFAAAEPGSAGGWMASDLADADWETMELPSAWDGSLSGFDGVVWFRREVDLPAAWAGRDLILELGPIDDMDTTWFNGTQVGEHMETGQWQTPRRYVVPGAAVQAGRNLIAVRALDTGGIGGLNGAPEQLALRPDGPGLGPSMLLGGPWRWRRGAPAADLPARPNLDEFHPNSPTALFNGMIAPIAPFGLRGAIWYQGESNLPRARQYRTLFPDLIRDWRRVWGRGDFPFYFAQIAPFAYGGDQGEAAALRDAQRRALAAVPNIGMAVTMDAGDPRDIHPRDKATVGHRLALWALARSYGREELECSGPLYHGMRVEDGRVRLFFRHAEGLRTAGGAPPSCFTIAGADRVFHPADAAILGDQILVSSPAVAHPQYVRYGGGAADQPNLVNGAGLPASSFDTGN